MVRFSSTTALICAFLCISYASAYTQQGNKIIDPNGKEVLIRGVCRPSFEWNPNGENANANDYMLMVGWGSNVARIALNQDYWLQGSGTYSSNYEAVIDQQIRWAKAAGMGVILDLHWSDKGNLHISGGANQQLMADTNSITFWGQVASKYKNDPWIMFELYNEPHDVSPKAWRDGGFEGGFEVAGMQQLYNAVRLAGAQNLVIVNGLDWAYNLQSVYPAYKITGTNIAYGTHPYNFEGKKQSNWPGHWGFVAKDYPVIMTEFGQYCADDGYVQQLMDYAHTNGIHFTAWAWYVGGCSFPSVISDWAGTAESRIGVIVKRYMTLAAGTGSTPSPNSPTTKPPTSKPPVSGATSAPLTPTNGPAVTIASNAQIIFDDEFRNGWSSWSWATVNFAVTNPVKAGSKAMSMVLNTYQGLYFRKSAAFYAGEFSAIQFYVNGGVVNSPDIYLQARDASGNPFGLQAIMPNRVGVNTWVLQTIYMTDLGLSSTVALTGFTIQYAKGDTNGNVIFVDHVQLVPAGFSSTEAPTPTHPATIAPTPKPATAAPTQPATPPATQSATVKPTQAVTESATVKPTQPAEPATVKPTQPATPSATLRPTPGTQTPARPSGNADCNTVCDASCIEIKQEARGSWGDAPIISQFSVAVENKCKTKNVKSLTLAATSWDPAGFWNAQTSDNLITLTLDYNPILATTVNSNFGYQNKKGQAQFTISEVSFQ